MLVNVEHKNIFMASAPVDFRLGIDGLSDIIKKNNQTHLLDGSIYVFYNGNRNKVKCLFWDGSGFVLYYKRLDQTRLKIKPSHKDVTTLTITELDELLSGMTPVEDKKPKLAYKSQ